MLTRAPRVVVKVGSSLVVSQGRIRRRWLDALARDVAELREGGQAVAIVSSGAVGLGLQAMEHRISELAHRQAAAAVGQIRLSQAYREAFARHGMVTAQVLVTPQDTEDRQRHLNARGTLEALLERGIVPVINENDTVATDEIKFGDNDRLAARVAQLISADLVVLLSDVDGLYDADPRRSEAAQHIPTVRTITPAVEAMAGGTGTSLGTGGMASKVAAARIALGAGAHLAIASGVAVGSLGALKRGGRATWFIPSVEPLTARKAWIAATVRPRGKVVADTGAIRAVRQGRSLLAVGVRAVEGVFRRGDPVRLVGEQGEDAGVGLVNYDSGEAARIAGHRSDRLTELLGYEGPDVLIHRDNLALTSREKGETRS
ncbi:MAG: glutamate 5-kinase [Gemmatimonadales bacterium]|nr:MAG: glutamate 5-kinase [Gemmatimonadales bacterium]